VTNPKLTAKSQGGFSLLETLVAFTILALSVGVLLRIFGGGAQMTSKADEHARAVTLAESLLVEKACEECELPPGETSGEIDEQFRWVMRVEPYQPEGEGWPDNLPIEPFWVEITLQWGETEQPQTFSLSTLRVKTKNARTGASPLGPRSALPYEHG
jgi:general secretion pathway protein I